MTTIDWATQTITNYANNKDGNFSEWAYEDIDWLDVGVSGFAGTATMGLDKLYKAGKIGKSIYNVGRASNLLVMPAISARYDLVAGDEVEGVNVNKGNDFWTPYIYNVVTTGIAARTSNNIVDGLLSDTPWILADPLKGGLYKNLLEIPIGVATGVATNNALQPNETTKPSMPPFPTKPPYEITPNKSNHESDNLNNSNDLYINLQIDRL